MEHNIEDKVVTTSQVTYAYIDKDGNLVIVTA
jgi:hypothetical protein|nr:MAG TPA: WG containing repeat protein [Caudoviricetes sp.]